MKNLKNIKKGLNEIAVLLAANKEIQKYLLIDEYNVDGVTFTPLTLNELFEQHYICLCPQHENGIKDMGRNTMLIMFLQDINFSATDENYIVSGAIHVVTDIDHARIYNNRDRALELADQIVQTIDGTKLTSASQINVSYISHVTYSEFTTGYKISFSFADQPNKRKAEL